MRAFAWVLNIDKTVPPDCFCRVDIYLVYYMTYTL